MVTVIVDLPQGYKDKYPFKDGDYLLCLGEIKNQKGHVAVVNSKGKVYFGYHIENFRLLTNDD
jgi:hypothetical protein